ncbi:MAG: LLM class flavin-dependent oxidoreductase [Nitrospinota bacterium]
MKFGVSPCQEKIRWNDTVEQSVKAEQWGYDSLWVQEHHSVEEGYYPSPFVALAAIAAHTKTVKLGTSVLIVPFYHPFHIAEDATMLDVISGGRCILGLGVGYRADEFALFNVSVKQRGGRTEEGTQIIRELWAKDRATFEGKYFQLKDAQLLPKPIQKPRPPIWMGGWTEPACDRAARLADAWFPGPTADLEKVKAAYGFYKNALGASDEEIRSREFPIMRELFCCKNIAAEKEALERLQHMYMEDYVKWGHKTTATGEKDVTFQGLMKDRFIVGPPEKCIEGLERFIDELGVNHLIFRMHFHVMREQAVLDSMELFAKECIPHLKKKYG